ncbi:MAG: PCRF domain-containing protein, partial [Gemmatimonadaceae bacterium]
MAVAGFWNDQETAQDVVQQTKLLRVWVEPFHSLDERVRSAAELNEMLRESPDAEMQAELDTDLESLDADLSAFELRSLLRGEDDFRHAQLEISAGAGGTEAQGWAELL